MRSTRTGKKIAALTAAMALALFGTLGNSLPAHAAPAADGLDLPELSVTEAPGVTAQNPDAAKLPTSRSTTEVVKGAKISLRPPAAGKASAPRMVDGAQVADAGCTPYIYKTVVKSGLDVQIEYAAEVVCNFYLAAAIVQAYLYERTSGSPYNGQIVATGARLGFANSYYAYSLGGVRIDGRVYDGGAQMEVGFSLALQAPSGAIWTGCLALSNGMRYLNACSGLGTSVLSVAVGSGNFATGLAPNRLAVLESLTQPTAESFSAWNIGRFYPETYAAYQFDWSNNECSWSPENPLGFTFESACIRHDFGYRNYKAAQRFPQNKDRIDSAFYEDLKRVCATYPSAVQPACYSLAWTYYETVRLLGALRVTQEQIDEAAKLLPGRTPGKAPLA